MSQNIVFGDHFSDLYAHCCPQWLIDFDSIGCGNRYSKEGMSDLVIMPIYPSISKEKYSQATVILKKLESLMAVCIQFERVVAFFKMINILVGNPLSQDVFMFKIRAIHTVFHIYPEFLFNENTCRKLATLSSFFPSAHEIEKVISQEKEFWEHKIQILRKIIQAYVQNI